jgi:hypothetical protein
MNFHFLVLDFHFLATEFRFLAADFHFLATGPAFFPCAWRWSWSYNRPEIPPQMIEKIESAPGNGAPGRGPAKVDSFWRLRR